MLGKLAWMAFFIAAVAGLGVAAVEVAKVSKRNEGVVQQTHISREIVCKALPDRNGVRCGIRELRFGSEVQLVGTTPQQLKADDLLVCTYQRDGGRTCRVLKDSGPLARVSFFI